MWLGALTTQGVLEAGVGGMSPLVLVIWPL